MYKYIIEFSKTDLMRFISHLDLMRLFVRTFKRAGIKPAYSKGYNPHPKMSFAQPLALGYTGLCELMEFETEGEYSAGYIEQVLSDMMPDGIEIKDCRTAAGLSKTLAALTESAGYRVLIPDESPCDGDEDLTQAYMGADSIIARKRKKNGEIAELDIKPMIRKIRITRHPAPEGSIVEAYMLIDQGSVSNLSPELVIETMKEGLGIGTDRSRIDVIRERIYFKGMKDIS